MKVTFEDIVFDLNELIQNCEGALMSSRGGKSLHNFAFCIQERLRTLKTDINWCLHDKENDE